MKSRTRTHALLVLPAAAAVLTLLVGCSDDAAQTAQEVTTAEPSADAQTQEMPEDNGVTGEIAAVSDLLMQVQGDDGQTAVTWDDSTTITQTVSGTLADVTAGVCVVAVTASEDDTATAATSIAITAATDGECTSGFGGGTGGGAGGDTADGTMPSGMPSGGTGEDAPDGTVPTDMASGAPSGGTGGFGAMTSGLVTAVDGSTITVETTDQDGATTTSTVTVDDSTTYTTTATADSSAITVGRCVTAQGEADDSGQVAATSLTLSDAGDDGCSTTSFSGGSFGGGQPGEDSTDE